MGEKHKNTLVVYSDRKTADAKFRLCYVPVLVFFFVSGIFSPCRAIVSENLLRNPSFEPGKSENGLPAGWSLYGGRGTNQYIKWVKLDDSPQRVIRLNDGDENAEIGLMQTCPAKPGLTYEASVEIRALEGATSYGAYLQLRFLPSSIYVQTSLACDNTKAFEKVSVKGTAPPNTDSARIYLYTHRDPTPSLLLRNCMLVSGVNPPPSPPPVPVPPSYTKLKDLHITTELVRRGKPNITIIVPASGIHENRQNASKGKSRNSQAPAYPSELMSLLPQACRSGDISSCWGIGPPTVRSASCIIATIRSSISVNGEIKAYAMEE